MPVACFAFYYSYPSGDFRGLKITELCQFIRSCHHSLFALCLRIAFIRSSKTHPLNDLNFSLCEIFTYTVSHYAWMSSEMRLVSYS
jgi:hypothetical protein